MEIKGDDNVGDIATASSEALEFIKNIQKDDIETCLFKDELVTVSEDNKTLGELTISIEKVAYAGDVVLLIHVNSHGKVDDTPTGTTITAYVRSDLTVIEQHHQEYVKVPNHELEKNTVMKRNNETNTFQVERQVTQGNQTRSESHEFPINDIEGLVTEGSNLLLQRLLAKSELQDYENLVFITIDPDSGKIFPSTYKALQERTQKVGKKEITAKGIERNLQSASDLPSTWQSFYMDDGHLTMRIQVGSPSVSMIEIVPQKIEKEEHEEKPIFTKKPLNWEEDEELHSMFLERKETLKAGHFTYLREHPDAQALLSDFFQFVLLRKPDDVVKFAGDYFSSFSAVLPESSSYLHSETS
uniref:ciliogenesis-associated TTC17-interacting protein-like n=1 Tax=Styela clava TaxID=7725 RepID=UPI00193AC211|nr:ciliogenesis-associated TTC17-interacting protein-like [Styela clava]